ncbi:cytidylate kinase [Sphingomonas sp. S17]|jgi:cytidylate kinase|uniref:Cytidylate kinase n=2 Tax=Sphingomonas paucimobilis TaxID=13689 RepID=A0A411LEW1_SPHPI|nr:MULTISPECIES: (d)CMP kinase [Sphingomonas]EGI54563.1 cytidylate kinase [Sphingomonas sp. S17]MBQ1480378.1 (d)CMP kinase [Sphingomonas sp.]MCM3680825.1 (d)CMP kinase [Sphingomonas paucimobilis]MDG5971468.1 (d)CMP kinase [Sphingomonas paucimobilis]NNG57382.1 (d)CMP kinase [Sphingomonas paucimobilis]
MIIAVDGPAASGKGTIARALARHYGLPHLDTGLLYRAVAATVRQMHLDPTKEADAVAACSFDDSLLADPALRDDETGKLASVVSAHPLVRAALLQRQKRFANQPGGAILDGRDIGTVIAPDADAKLFVKASPQVRARRRHNELAANGSTVTFEQVLADIRARDERDSGRATAPLTQAADAAALDTSSLTIDAAVARAIQFVDAQVAAKARP